MVGVWNTGHNPEIEPAVVEVTLVGPDPKASQVRQHVVG